MKNAWLGYLGSFITLLGAVVMIVAGRYILGSILILAAIGGVIVKYYLGKKKY
ncbi:MAG: hypothetical protein H0W73_01910 [Bacteroidetes bacterium]|nr:hypothetical protein [Bacteroidota bacterium]